MKKYLSIIAGSACAVSAFAQGTVVFNNSSSSVIQKWTSAADPTLMAVPRNTGKVQLLYAPTGTPGSESAIGGSVTGWLWANPGWSLGPMGIFNAPVAGRYNLGEFLLYGIASGSQADYIVLGWTGTAASFDAAIAANEMVGISGKFTTATGGSGLPPSPGVPLADSMTSGFTLGLIPEPSAFALAGLGSAVWLSFRRR